jgi:hypothetical protein
MLIDDYIPRFDFSECHETKVAAPPDVVRQTVQEWEPARSFPWRWLMRLRGLGSPRGSLRQIGEGAGFLPLAETDEEVVYGQAGRFWAPNERAALVSPRTVDEFRSLRDPRIAIAVLNIAIGPDALGRGTRLSTETRVRCLGAPARRWFRLYWLAIRPFSGLMRRAMLRGIRADALRAVQRSALSPTDAPDEARAL